MGLILRIDDVGWLPDINPDGSKQIDKGLHYFQRWREALGLQGAPVYYGIIPQTVGASELSWLHSALHGGEELAVHGWDHARGAEVEAKHMDLARRRISGRLSCRCYIPPFNEYKQLTIDDWGRVCPQGYFFGGFSPRTTSKEMLPKTYKTGYFLPAIYQLYNHSEQLLEEIPKFIGLECPLTVTMHCTWGAQRLDLVSEVGRVLQQDLQSIDIVRSWYERISLLSRSNLTAPHYLAYHWIVDRLLEIPLGLGKTTLDFGTRYSFLPALSALHGFRVTACDRDLGIKKQQKEACAKMGVSTVNVLHPIQHPSEIPEKYDVVICCWALQHNLPANERIPDLVQSLSQKVNPGGRMLIVGSFTPRVDSTITQTNRPDPQEILNQQAYDEMIFKPSGMEVSKQEYFYYESDSTIGDFCSANKANATCIELVKV